jgi:subtilisin family serine protease
VLPLTQLPYGIKMIYGNPALIKGNVNGGTGITVAVLDTGIINHPDFIRADGTNVIVSKVDFSQTKYPVVVGVANDGHGHGTHVTQDIM